VVGRSYPPEFYSWITVPHVRSLFEKIAIETEEDYQNIIKKLESFGVKVLRPDLPKYVFAHGKYQPPPMTPRDHTVMIGDVFYSSATSESKFQNLYKEVKDQSWPLCASLSDFFNLPTYIQKECEELHGINEYVFSNEYDEIYKHVQQQGNDVSDVIDFYFSGATVSRVGRDLYFGTNSYTQDQVEYKSAFDKKFTQTRTHIVNTGGHGDGTYCPVCPGLIISLHDVPTYADTFPGWEVVYLPGQSWDKIKPFKTLKKKNKGRWWIPGFEHDNEVIDVVEQWLGHWTGYVEETVFDVNMLIIDPKNVMVFGYNKQVFDALDRYGITPHVVPFRHRYFWDGGIHCVTSDLHREGTMQDYFPQRG
jgi:glycine amidinotransferase